MYLLGTSAICQFVEPISQIAHGRSSIPGASFAFSFFGFLHLYYRAKLNFVDALGGRPRATTTNSETKQSSNEDLKSQGPQGPLFQSRRVKIAFDVWGFGERFGESRLGQKTFF